VAQPAKNTSRKKPSTVFYFSAKTQYSNAGDALINREILRYLRDYGEIRAAVRDAPPEFLDELGLDAHERRYVGGGRLTLAAAIAGLAYRLGLGPRAVLVMSPGDPLMYMNMTMVYRGMLTIVLAILGAAVLRPGVSMTKDMPNLMRLEAIVSRFMLYTGLRDTHSLQATERAGFRNIGYFPDLALTLPAPTRSSFPEDGPLRIGLSLRNDVLDGDGTVATLETAVRSALRSIAGDRAVRLVLVAQVQRDAEFLSDLMVRLAPDYDCVLRDEQYLDPLAEIYGQIDVVLTNRLHSFLYSAAHGCVPYGLLWRDKNTKIVALLNDCGLADLWADLARCPEPAPTLDGLQAARPSIRRAFAQAERLARQKLDALLADQAEPEEMLLKRTIAEEF
jgi:hypothetical protein